MCVVLAMWKQVHLRGGDHGQMVPAQSMHGNPDHPGGLDGNEEDQDDLEDEEESDSSSDKRFG